MHRTLAATTLLVLICLSAVGGMVVKEVAALDRQLSLVIKQTRKGQEFEAMQELVEQVKRPSGRVVTVRTVREDGETVEAFIERHDAVVAGLL
jgi:hypothetical protein